MKKVSRKKVLISEQSLDEIGERIAWLRKERGQSLSAFAAVISVSKGNLSDIEKNRYKPSYQTIVKISEQFGVNTGWLINGEGYAFDREGKRCCLRNPDTEGPLDEIVDLVVKIGELDNSLLGEIVDFLREKFSASVLVYDRRSTDRRGDCDECLNPECEERREQPDRRLNISKDNKKKDL